MNITVSLELAIRMFGSFNVETTFVWTRTTISEYMLQIEPLYESIPAPTAEEILSILPKVLGNYVLEIKYIKDNFKDQDYKIAAVTYINRKVKASKFTHYNKSLAEALGNLWCDIANAKALGNL